MLVVMRSDASENDIDLVLDRLSQIGMQGHLSRGAERTVVGVIGRVFPELSDVLAALDGVETVIRISKPYKLSSREFKPEDTVVQVGDVSIGGRGAIVVMAGPCAVESEAQTLASARAVKRAGANILRGGAFKPSTSPYTFRGLGEVGLEILAMAREETGLPVVTEVLAPADVDLVARYADVLQVGARNMQNYLLLEEVGRSGKPVLLKRGLAATVEELLLASEYILSQGNPNVMLCERGIRTFETATRFTMDLSAIALIREVSHLPVIADPSHATGKPSLITPMSLASIAAGADGLMIEVHPNPDHALKDGPQALTFSRFEALMHQAAPVAEAVGRRMVLPSGLAVA